VAFSFEFCRPVHGVLQDVEKLRYGLIPARHSRFDSVPWEPSGRSFEPVQNLGCFHASYPIAPFCPAPALPCCVDDPSPFSYGRDRLRVPKLS
jgi:hypothetical protein